MIVRMGAIAALAALLGGCVSDDPYYSTYPAYPVSERIVVEQAPRTYYRDYEAERRRYQVRPDYYYAGRPQRPYYSGRPEYAPRPPYAGRPDRPQRPPYAGRPDRPQRPPEAGRPQRPDRPPYAGRPDRPQRPPEAGRPQRPPEAGRPARPPRPEDQPRRGGGGISIRAVNP